MAGNDEESLFVEAMGKVKPLSATDKVVVNKPKLIRPAKAQRVRQAHIVTAATSSVAQAVQPTDDPWVLIADGVSRERLKRLAAGRPPVGRSFDLHGMTRDQALAELEQGFAQVIADGVRALCIIHGRGLHSQGRPILKDAVYHWLREGAYAPSVLAVMPQPGSGGGACLLLLRRNS